MPLYWLLTNDQSSDEFITNLTTNNAICKMITNVSAKQLLKVLTAKSKSKMSIITDGIVRFRSLEELEHKAFQQQINNTKEHDA